MSAADVEWSEILIASVADYCHPYDDDEPVRTATPKMGAAIGFLVEHPDNRIVSHIPAEPERPEWADALVVRDGNGSLWAADRGGLSGRKWTRIPNNFTSHHDAEWVERVAPITVIIDADGNNVEAEAHADGFRTVEKQFRDMLKQAEKREGLALDQLHRTESARAGVERELDRTKRALEGTERALEAENSDLRAQVQQSLARCRAAAISESTTDEAGR